MDNENKENYSGLDEQIGWIGKNIGAGQVGLVIIGDIKLKPGMMKVTSSCGIYVPDVLSDDEEVLPAVFSLILNEAMRKKPAMADAVLLAAKKFVEEQSSIRNNISLN